MKGTDQSSIPYRAGRGPRSRAQVVEKVGILRALAEELLQVDAGLIELAGCEVLVGAGEVVGHCKVIANCY